MNLGQSWRYRKSRLRQILDVVSDDEEAEGIALDEYLSKRPKLTGKGPNIDSLRFSNRDLATLGALSQGPFGTVDMVRCHLNNKLYVRKSVEKRVVARNRDQCNPHHERDLLRAATVYDSQWAPHLLCSFQTPTALCYVMDFATGGSMADLLESAGQTPEADIKWWLPQMVSAIDWCHEQRFCHRDIKPSNFVITPEAHLLLIDFGSSVRLLPAQPNGVQLVPKASCLVLCGTCDYISPEILRMQEDALVAFDAAEEIFIPADEGGYGRETDWWSLGVTIYELVYGVAPFFAKDIRATYDRIIHHQSSLKFDPLTPVTSAFRQLLLGLLTEAESRLGRSDIYQIKAHSFFAGTPWSALHTRPRPESLILPDLEYDLPSQIPIEHTSMEESFSKGFAFSAFFEPSQESASASAMGNVTFLRPTSPQVHAPAPGSHIGFSWGPVVDAFDGLVDPEITRAEHVLPITARPLHSATMTPLAQSKVPLPIPSSVKRIVDHPVSAPASLPHGHRAPAVAFETPVRAMSFLDTGPGIGIAPPSTIRHIVGSSARKVGTTRMLDELEALKAMGDCVRASARKKIVELSVGRPMVHASGGGRRGTDHRLKLKLDFENVSGESGVDVWNRDASAGPHHSAKRPGLRVFIKERSYSHPGPRRRNTSNGIPGSGSGSWLMGSNFADGSKPTPEPQPMQDTGTEGATTDTASEPPSPSPMPGSTSSRRGSTPAISTPRGPYSSGAPGSGSARLRSGNRSNSLTPMLRVPSVGSISFRRNKTTNTDRIDPMGLFRSGEKAARGPVAMSFEGDDGDDDDATPRPLARHVHAPEPDQTLLAPPLPAFQATQFAETSLNPFSEPNTTGRNRTRSQNESQIQHIQHIRTEEVIDIAKSDEEMESNGSPRDLQDEYMKEVAELEEQCKRRTEAMEARLAEMTEDIRVIEEGLHAVGDRIGRALGA